jgi:hypothetical protein
MLSRRPLTPRLRDKPKINPNTRPALDKDQGMIASRCVRRAATGVSGFSGHRY